LPCPLKKTSGRQRRCSFDDHNKIFAQLEGNKERRKEGRGRKAVKNSATPIQEHTKESRKGNKKLLEENFPKTPIHTYFASIRAPMQI